MFKKIISIGICLIAITLFGCGGNPNDGGGENNMPDTNPITEFDNSLNTYSERIGVTYWGAKYMPREYSGSSLTAACDILEEMGAKVIKVAAGDVSTQYPLDDFKVKTFEKSVDVLKHDIFRDVFERSFKTFYISVPERKAVKWVDGINENEKAYVESEFYEMTKYLLNTYKGSGKVFVLQNWETDNYISANRTKEAMRNYAEYFNCRQNGINRARDEFVMSEANNVYVFGAIEINILTEKSYLRAVDEIVPYTYCDLYLYSSYESKDKGVVNSAKEVKERLVGLMTYYKSKLPNENKYPQPMYFKDRRLVISEFGYPDYGDGYSGERTKMIVEGHLLASDIIKAQHVLYWQIACNESIGENKKTIDALRGEELRAYELKPGDINGFYLIRPDGVKTYTYNYLTEVIKSNNIEVSVTQPNSWK